MKLEWYLILSVFVSGFTTLFRIAIREDGALWFYFPLLSRLFYRLGLIKCDVSDLPSGYSERTIYLLDCLDSQRPYLIKLLGGCGICMNTHLSWVLGILFYRFGYFEWYGFLLLPFLSILPYRWMNPGG